MAKRDDRVIRAKILGARTPRDALGVVSDYIDRLYDRIEKLETKLQEPNGWDSWDEADEKPYDPVQEDEIERSEPTGRIRHITTGETTTVEIAEPTPDQAKLRKLLTTQRMDLLQRSKEVGWQLKPEQDPDVMYWRYGPYWLYTIDRDYVMMLPFETRQLFVTDIELDDPQIAREVARDILKADAQDSNTSGI